ncbi:MAG TPA: universal stress protein [Gemmatimonadales bacterium]|nr:universal stress protein [Gemmatimonadales bacterium]
MFRSILVPLDGSTLAEQALPLAAAIAEWHKASLSLAVVHPWGPAEDAPKPGTRFDRQMREEEGVYLNRLMQAVATAYRVPVCETLLDGSSGPKLVQLARDRGIDLVVASTHGYGQLGRLRVGGVARHLAHGLGATVLFVKPQAGPVRMTAHGGFGRILVALDGSSRAEAALAPATALASRDGVVLALARVVSPDPSSLNQRRTEAAAYLASVARRLQRRGRRVQSAVLVGDDAAEAVLTYAQEEAMELVALTTRERGSAARTLFGSIADAAIHKAHIPVLVCHAAPAGAEPEITLAGSVR